MDATKYAVYRRSPPVAASPSVSGWSEGCSAACSSRGAASQSWQAAVPGLQRQRRAGRVSSRLASQKVVAAPRPRRNHFATPRGAATIFCGASLLLTLPALRCFWSPGTAACQDWLAPPHELHAALHPSLHPDTLGDAATGGLLLYTAYLIASIVRGAQRTAHADDS